MKNYYVPEILGNIHSELHHKVSYFELQEFCQIGILSTDLRERNRKIVNQNFFNLYKDKMIKINDASHTGKLSKIVHSHTGKLSN